MLCKYEILALTGLGINSPVPNSTFSCLGSGFTKTSITVMHFRVGKDEELAKAELASFPHLHPHHTPT